MGCFERVRDCSAWFNKLLETCLYQKQSVVKTNWLNEKHSLTPRECFSIWLGWGRDRRLSNWREIMSCLESSSFTLTSGRCKRRQLPDFRFFFFFCCFRYVGLSYTRHSISRPKRRFLYNYNISFNYTMFPCTIVCYIYNIQLKHKICHPGVIMNWISKIQITVYEL